MSALYNILRLAIQFLLFTIFGLYLDQVLNQAFLIWAYCIIILLVYFLDRIQLKAIPAIALILLMPWIIRAAVILIQHLRPSFLQISFDMNFFLILPALYLAALLTWFALTSEKFGKYEVLINGVILYLLFFSQGNYRVTLLSRPLWLALIALLILILELLVLYLSVLREKKLQRSAAGAAGELLMFFILLMPLVIYLILPLWEEYEEGSVAGGGGLLKTSMFRFDFSEYIKLETEISMSDDLVLMYRKEGPAERMLLRRYVLSGYEEGQGFFRHERDKTSPPDKVPPRYMEFEIPGYRNRETVDQELFLVNIDPSAFLSLNQPVDVQPIYNWDNSSFVRIYRSRALVNTIPVREIDPQISMDDEMLSHYTFTGENESVASLTAEVTEGVPGSFLKTLAIEDYFHSNYYYSLKPGVAPDGDQLSWFMEETKKGYCSYFAFSMALMCRSLDIPARVAVGFWVDPDVSVLNFYPVRADQAHAWVEVFFDDYGWIEFDPTSSVMFPGEQYPFAGFSIDEFSPLIEEILDNEMAPENLPLSDDSVAENGESVNDPRSVRLFLQRSWYIILIALYCFYIVSHHYLFYLLFLIRRSTRKKASFLYRDLRMKLSFEKKKFRESLSAYAVRLEEKRDIPFLEFTGLYQKSLFAPRFNKEDLENMMDLRRKTIERYRKEIPAALRLLHFLFPIAGSRKL